MWTFCFAIRRPSARWQARDEFVEHVFQAAGLPLMRVPVRALYSVSELGKQLHTYLKITETLPLILEEPKPEPPRCPKCGTGMVLRTAKSGSKEGGKFCGCSRFPQCRGNVSIGEDNLRKSVYW